jgi:hypothetical protein
MPCRISNSAIRRLLDRADVLSAGKGMSRNVFV